MSKAPKQDIRDFFTARSSSAKLSELYAHMAAMATGRTIRETSRTVEEMEARGELLEGPPGEYRLADLPPSSSSRGVVHERLWRAIHQITDRSGSGKSADLAALAHCTTDAARKWVTAMLNENRLVKLQLPGWRFPQYKVAPEQPSAEQPPAFRWPRRGVTKCRKDGEA